jgi:hypothetical protein
VGFVVLRRSFVILGIPHLKLLSSFFFLLSSFFLLEKIDSKRVRSNPGVRMLLPPV